MQLDDPDQLDQMTCRELVELVTEYLEGTLPEEDRVRFDDHLVSCPHCVTYLDQMRTTVGLLGTLSEDQVPHQARDELLSAFRDWKRTGQ
jgi:anti-sigma factor RsiW